MFEVTRKTRKECEHGFDHKVAEFIPFACHYNPHTILTKNGALLQTIRIIAFSQDFEQDDQLNVRSIIRETLTENNVLSDVSLWFHTIRSQRDLAPDPVDPSTVNTAHPVDTEEDLASTLHQAWCRKNYWHNKFVNEIYITFVRDAESLSSKKNASLWRLFSLSPKRQLSRHCKEGAALLDQIVAKVLEALKPIGAARLSIETDEEGVYSGPLQFYTRLIHMVESKMLLPIIDLSEYLASHPLFFGKNVIEVSGDRQKRFAAILSLKAYHELSPSSMDSFLQLPFEWVITQYVDQFPMHDPLAQSAEQREIVALSGDKLLQDYFSVTDEEGRSIPLGSQQTTIMVIADDQESLAKKIKRVNDELSQHGILAVREDLFLESGFWSQLPGNFRHLQRLSNLPQHLAGGYAQLYSFAAGNLYSRWGSAITIFRSIHGNPFFFHFHDKGAGNSCIVGGLRHEMQLLAHFLLAETSRVTAHQTLLYFGTPNLPYLKAMQIPLYGAYGEPAAANSPTIDPSATPVPILRFFDLATESWITEWLQLAAGTDSAMAAAMAPLAAAATASLLALTPQERSLAALIAWLTQEGPQDATLDPAAKASLHAWAEALLPYELPETLPDVNADLDAKSSGEGTRAFSLGALKSLPLPVAQAILLAIWQQRMLHTDGSKALLFVDQLDCLFEYMAEAQNLRGMIAAFNEKNGLLFAGTTLPATQRSAATMHTFLQTECDTLLCFENHAKNAEMRSLCGITNQELAKLGSLSLVNRLFLIKQGAHRIMLELNITGMDPLRALLSGEAKALQTIETLMKTHGDAPKDWLQPYIEAYE